MCRQGRSPGLAHVALKAELCQESLGQWLPVRGGPPRPGQVPSPHHELGWALWALMLLLLLCHDRV